MRRIVIDARPGVDPRRTGIGRYADALVRYLPPADPDADYVAWYLDVRGIGTRAHRYTGSGQHLTEVASRIPTRVFGPVSSRIGIPRVEWLVGSFDLLVATNFLPPPTSSRGVVVVVHDLAFEVMPDTAPHHDARWRRRFGRWLEASIGVIVPSASVRDDLVRIHGVDAARIDVIHHGVDADAFRGVLPVEVETVRRRYGLEGPYVLFVGALERRKNLEVLVRGFGLLDDPSMSLVLAGGAVRWARDIPERLDAAVAGLPDAIRRRVVRTGYVSDASRRALLAGAEVLAYPSRYEGFGFPVLEAFAANIPVLTAKVSSMPELAGDAAVFVDPDDPGSIAEGLRQLIDDEDLRNVLRAAGTARVSSFTWERCARQTAAALGRAAERMEG